MKLKIGEKEYSIKFGYKPTLKERVVSKVVKMSDTTNDDGEIDIEKVEDMMLFLPELLLVGLQVHHEEFRYDYDNKDEKEEKLDKAFALVDEYMNEENADVMTFFNKLQEALLQDSFLRSLFQKEKKRHVTEEPKEGTTSADGKKKEN